MDFGREAVDPNGLISGALGGRRQPTATGPGAGRTRCNHGCNVSAAVYVE